MLKYANNQIPMPRIVVHPAKTQDFNLPFHICRDKDNNRVS